MAERKYTRMTVEANEVLPTDRIADDAYDIVVVEVRAPYGPYSRRYLVFDILRDDRRDVAILEHNDDVMIYRYDPYGDWQRAVTILDLEDSLG